MNLLQSFQSFIKKENLFQQNAKLLLAVSGGVDSVVLCELCKQSEYNFIIAHCNFQLREEESERDEQFVRDLGEKYRVKVFVKKFDTERYALKSRTGIQEAARKLRYDWFNEIVKDQWSRVNGQWSMGDEQWANQPETRNSKFETQNQQPSTNNGQQPTYILTAHHANDNVETLLMNFFKGTGISGLRGILPKQGNIIRPLLFATKQELQTFAEDNNLPFVEDSSNILDKYTRNFFRQKLIPSIEKVFPSVEENLMDNLKRFIEIEILYYQAINSHKKNLLEQKGEETHIPVLKLLKTEPLSTVVYEIIKQFNFTSRQTDEIIHLLRSETGKYVQSSTHKIIRNRNWLIISPNNTEEAQNILIEENDKTLKFFNGKLQIEKLPAANYPLSTVNSVASLDADEIKFPLLLRKWKQGDYFYPLGMKKKKKLSRFFIDQKLSLTEKQNCWVLEMNKKIVWIVGKRIDERFKLTSKTKNILRISLR
jgi:tRNA(Ile)-lysidine synthase